MILIFQNLRNNLQHPNVYIRGAMLWFLCRLNKTEIIEPLIPSILSNLEHCHPFIQRNVILAVMALYKLPQGELLLNSALEIIEKLLSTEQDNSTKHAQDRAINYLSTHIDRINDWGEQLQMVVLELIRKVYRTTNKGEKGKYIKISISLLNAPSSVVVYECARTLVSLFSALIAIRAVATTYCQLLLSHGDHNVKLIVLDRLNELTTSNRDIRWNEVESGIATIKQCLRGLPFYTHNEEGEGENTSKSTPLVSSISVENVLLPPTLIQGLQSSTGNLKSLILSEGLFFGAVIAYTLIKLILRLVEVQTSKVKVNKATTQALLIMVSILQLGQSLVGPLPIDNDSHDRIVFCIRLL
ncbi:hypothetical protein K1719_038605 [Acacia pycnantha]|nr:hypothetical protein K1719_038605 [Acacia pycnantha]